MFSDARFQKAAGLGTRARKTGPQAGPSGPEARATLVTATGLKHHKSFLFYKIRRLTA
jgi:hypothetical protein